MKKGIKSTLAAFTFLLLLISSVGIAQSNADSTGLITKNKQHFFKQFARPVTFIGLGIYGTINNGIINRDEIKEERNEYFPSFSNGADNYLQYAPIALVYALDVFGLKGKHNRQQQTVLFGTAELIMTGIVLPVKKYSHVLCPDSSSYNSFPSGHTAQAFLAGIFFQKEFGAKYPWLSAGMFTLATGIGAFRVLNNRHWVSDVLAGAGIGILSAELSYALLKNKVRHRKGLPDTVIPGYNKGSVICTAIYKS